MSAPRKPRTTLAALDFSALAVEDTTEPLKATRSSKVDETPVPAWLAESHATGVAKAVTLPDEQAKSLVALLRTAANRAGLGVKIVADNLGDGTTRVRFQGKARRAYTPRGE